MCFGDEQTYTTRTYVTNGAQYSEEYSRPRHGMSWRRKHGFGGSYYPSRYYSRPPNGRYMNSAVYSNRYSGYSGYPQGASYSQYNGYYSPYSSYPRGYTGYLSGYGRYYGGGSVAMPHHAAVPRYGQRGALVHQGQQANGAYPTGVIPNAGYGYGAVGMGMGMGVGMGVGVGVAAGGYPGVYAAGSYHQPYTQPYTQPYSYYGGQANYYSPPYYPAYNSAYSGYYNYGLYGSLYPLANFYYPYQRTYYNTAPSYGYSAQAYVYPPGPSATTTTTTYHVTNSQAGASGYANVGSVPQPRPMTTQGPTREDIQMENRRVATERGAYNPRRIKPADARDDDPFWCQERNGEWHLRSFYQIENECHPGRWLMDAELGFLVFHRD